MALGAGAMRPLRAAVVGVGYLGRYHAQKYAGMPDVTLAAVVDIDAKRVRQVGAELGVPAFTDRGRLAGRVDLASVAVPTRGHFAVARDLLDAGIHVLVEKPICAAAGEARALIALAERRNLTLQVGHLERFNPVMQALRGRVTTPRFIEAYRVSPFRARGTDVSVVMDLMIHDIDLILDLVRAPIERIDANGVSVLSSAIDVANARILFAGGCVANVTASRVSFKQERRMRLFQDDAYLSVDFDSHQLDVRRKTAPSAPDGLPGIDSEQVRTEAGDALAAEIRAFADSVRYGTDPLVGGRDGLRALETAVQVLRQLRVDTRPPWDTGFMALGGLT